MFNSTFNNKLGQSSGLTSKNLNSLTSSSKNPVKINIIKKTDKSISSISLSSENSELLIKDLNKEKGEGEDEYIKEIEDI